MANERFFFWKGIQQSGLIIEMIIQKNVKDLERRKVLVRSHETFFGKKKIAIYIYTAWNAKLTSTRNLYEKTNEMEEEKISEAYLKPNGISAMKLF